MRDLYEIANECADHVVTTAHCAGYEVNDKRAVFFRSDVGDLADDIYNWLSNHMEPEEILQQHPRPLRPTPVEEKVSMSEENEWRKTVRDIYDHVHGFTGNRLAKDIVAFIKERHPGFFMEAPTPPDEGKEDCL